MTEDKLSGPRALCWATLFSIAGLILVLGAAGVWGAYA